MELFLLLVVVTHAYRAGWMFNRTVAMDKYGVAEVLVSILLITWAIILMLMSPTF